MGNYDLHLHTEWSYDAENSIEDYFRIADEKKIRTIAITDHHLMDGYDEVLEVAAKYPEVGYFSGGELTVHCELGEFDLVCLNLPRRPTPDLVDLFNIYRNWQIAYGHALSENFLRRGFPLDDAARMELLKSYRPAKAIAKQGNSHVQYRALWTYCVEHGFAKDKDDYNAKRETFTDMPDYPEYDIVIPAVKRAGGVVLLAHPKGYFLTNDLKRMDYLRELFSLDGVECAFGSCPEELVRFYREYCRKYGLLSSAGSDLHSSITERYANNFGEECWLDELMERIELHHGA